MLPIRDTTMRVRRALLAQAALRPALTGLIALGDSRTANAGGNAISGGTQTSRISTGNGVSGWYQTLLGNKVLSPAGWNYGLGDSTSYNLQIRNNSASIASTGNPALGVTGRTSDQGYSISSDGFFSPVGNPANLVIMLMGVNDPTQAGYYTSPLKTFQAQKTILDDLTAVGKPIILANELPRGNGIISQEFKTVTAGTCTATNTTGFIDSRAWNEAAVQDHLGNPLTYTSGTPGNGQYSVTTSGVYTFNTGSGVVPTGAYLTYSYGSPVTTSYQRIMHDWQSSSAANFVDFNGVDYGVPGALYNRPLVVSADTWGALIDSTSGASYLSLPGMFDSLQLHCTVLGGLRVAKAVKTAFDAAYPAAVSLAQAPNRNNWRAARGTGSSTVFVGTLPPTMRSAATGGPAPTQIRLGATVIGTVDTGTGAITGTNITSGSLNFTTGAFTITFSVAPALSVFIYFEQDFTNLQENGLMDNTAATLGTSPTGSNLTGTGTGTLSITGTSITASQIPYGWTLLCNTAMQTAITSGAVTLSLVNATNRYGRPCVRLVGFGIAASAGTITLSAVPQWARLTAGDKVRSGCERVIAAGANGSLYGLTAADVTGSVTSSASVSRATPTGTASMTVAAGKTMSGVAGFPWGNAVLVENGEAFSQELVTPPFDTTGFTISNAAGQLIITVESGKPFSFTVEYSDFHCRVRTD